MMSEPESGAPIDSGNDQPQPFSQGPQDPPGGCGRPLLIGCSVAIVLAGLLLLGVLLTARDLMPTLLAWSLDQFEQQISNNLPADLDDDERQRLSDAFDAAITAVEDGLVDTAALQRLQGALLDVARSGRLSRDDVLDLIEALEAVAGESSRPPATPAPDVGEEPMPVASRQLMPRPRLSAA